MTLENFFQGENLCASLNRFAFFSFPLTGGGTNSFLPSLHAWFSISMQHSHCLKYLTQDKRWRGHYIESALAGVECCLSDRGMKTKPSRMGLVVIFRIFFSSVHWEYTWSKEPSASLHGWKLHFISQSESLLVPKAAGRGSHQQPNRVIRRNGVHM